MVPRLSPWAIKFCPWYRFDPLVPKCWPQLPKSFVPLVGAVRVVGVIEVVEVVWLVEVVWVVGVVGVVGAVRVVEVIRVVGDG